MHFVYVDESGDDGYPERSSELFVLSAVYFSLENWDAFYTACNDFKAMVRQPPYNIPVKLEMHARPFLLKKKPYTGFGHTPETRARLIDEYCLFIGGLDCRLVNVAIVKPRIAFGGYSVLEKAVSYLTTRIENDMREADDRYVMIVDEGRLKPTRRTTRRLHAFNPVPSQFGGDVQRVETIHMVEDPLPKESQASCFLQLADVVACVVSLYVAEQAGTPVARRLRKVLAVRSVANWMDMLRPSLNLAACRRDPYGVMIHPQ